MEKLLLVLAVIAMVGCEPFPSPESEKPSTSTAQVQNDVESIQDEDVEEDVDDDTPAPAAQSPEQKKFTKKLKYKPQDNIRLSANEVVISQGSNSNIQTVKRVEDKDAICWVVMNTKSWEGSISCIPRSTIGGEQPYPEVKP